MSLHNVEYIYKSDYEVINGRGIAKGYLIGGFLEILNNLHGRLTRIFDLV